jgi:hypothetical protein
MTSDEGALTILERTATSETDPRYLPTVNSNAGSQRER